MHPENARLFEDFPALPFLQTARKNEKENRRRKPAKCIDFGTEYDKISVSCIDVTHFYHANIWPKRFFRKTLIGQGWPLPHAAKAPRY